MESSQTQILTPDQRLRVFISSTLQELATEREAAKKAIQEIHLTPVMFELGARPHAPRNLYREYLAQSQIFVGIYWDRYGWVAPEESISGLEDEYNLSGNMPKLIYIKNSSGKREERLTELLHKIQRDDKVSYKSFSNADELSNLIINDLAVLLTERFNLSLRQKLNDNRLFQSLPAAPNALIGREKCLEHITGMLKSPNNRMITLFGPGGIGKTRLAIESARRIENHFRDGVAFIPLAPVRDPKLVAETICYNLGIKVSAGNTLDSLKIYLQDKHFLLLLDNFEQIVDAASIIDDLLFAAPNLKILVTSRERLSLSFEQVVAVPPLQDSFKNNDKGVTDQLPPAVELFINRAKSIQPDFEMTDQNRDKIFQICHCLEGLPLAIELAAGQINLLSPQLLLQKLDHRLDVLKGNFRDIPDRQKTIRKTIEWSFDLLTETEQDLLLRISLFNAGCTLQAIEFIGADLGEDVMMLLDSLLNKSLLSKQDEEMQVRFQMFESVREFAVEKIKAQNKLESLQLKQADFYLASLHAFKLQKNKVDQSVALSMMEKEHPNIRQVMDFLLQKNELIKLTQIAWNLWLFWWVNAHTKEGYSWLIKAWEQYKKGTLVFDDKTLCLLATNVGIMSFLQRDFASYTDALEKNLECVKGQDDDELVATALLIAGVVATILKQYEKSDQYLQTSLAKYKKIGLTTGISLALSGLGRNAIYAGNKIKEAKEYYRQSIALAKEDRNEISVIICLSGFALCEVMEKSSDAKNYLRESILLSQSLHFYEALAWSLEIWALVSINENKFTHAVTLLGAVNHLRVSTHMPVWDDLEAIIDQAKDQIQQSMPTDMFMDSWNAGSKMNIDQMVGFAMER
jgi:predicted ATPase